jgi:hypothetical protein
MEQVLWMAEHWLAWALASGGEWMGFPGEKMGVLAAIAPAICSPFPELGHQTHAED